jgi:predicted nucleotidyltransferase
VNLSAPLTDVATGVRGRVLQALVRLEQPVTRRQLAVAAGVTPGHSSSVIDHLIISGLITEIRSGQASLVALNRSHLAAPGVIALASLRGELIRRLRGRLGEWEDLMGAWLFGSVARAEAGIDSDIDVLLVTPDLESLTFHERLTQLQADTRLWTGNDLQVVEHTPASWRSLKTSKNALVEQIRIDGVPLRDNDPALLERLR